MQIIRQRVIAAVCLIPLALHCGKKDKDSNVEVPRKNGLGGTLPGSLPSGDNESAFFLEDNEIAKDKCVGANMREIRNMPKNVQAPSEGTFTYKYEYILKPNARGTVLYLPGGPGGDSIGAGEVDPELAEFNIVYIDPRGTGCNFLGKDAFKLKHLTTAMHAQDVIRVIQELRLTDYIVYGISYGTLIGTVVAFEAEKLGLRPRAVVLQGIVGKAFLGPVRQQMELEFNDLVNSRPKIANFFRSPKPIAGIPIERWSEFSQKLLYYSRGDLGDALEGAIDSETQPPGPDRDKYLSDIQKFVNQVLDQKEHLGFATFFVAVGAREVFGQNNTETALEDGRLVRKPIADPHENDFYNNLGPKAYYDSAQYQIQAPIYYIQGAHDPATPMPFARLHFDGQQRSAKKIWLAVANGGHTPTGATDQLESCAVELWDRIWTLQNFDGLVKADGTCVANPATGYNLNGPSRKLLDLDPNRLILH